MSSHEPNQTRLYESKKNIQGGPKVSLHTLALIAQSLSARSK